ncbi:MAG: hypothetical protein JWQ35_983 [Bacteriovoracaceae bacterium]|nr:hypothetical protein [Bacteriovoracaceae bacterium]
MTKLLFLIAFGLALGLNGHVAHAAVSCSSKTVECDDTATEGAFICQSPAPPAPGPYVYTMTDTASLCPTGSEATLIFQTGPGVTSVSVCDAEAYVCSTSKLRLPPACDTNCRSVSVTLQTAETDINGAPECSAQWVRTCQPVNSAGTTKPQR